HTGDYAHFDADGYCYFGGRATERIRRLAENISAPQIEELVDTHPAGAEPAPLPHPSPLGEDDIRLAVPPQEGAALDAGACHAWRRGRRPRYMLPRYIEFCAQLPRTQSGKAAKTLLIRNGLGASAWDAGPYKKADDAGTPSAEAGR